MDHDMIRDISGIALYGVFASECHSFVSDSTHLSKTQVLKLWKSRFVFKSRFAHSFQNPPYVFHSAQMQKHIDATVCFI